MTSAHISKLSLHSSDIDARRPTKFVSKIFWPLQCATPLRSGLVIGWNLRDFVACVAMVVPNLNLVVVESALTVLHRDIDLEDMWKYTFGAPVVLGRWMAKDTPNLITDEESLAREFELDDRKRSSNFWLTLTPATNQRELPSVQSIDCCGFLYHTSAHIVLYQSPKAASFLSDEAFSFDWSNFWSSSSPRSSSSISLVSDPSDLQESASKLTVTQVILRQINTSSMLNAVFNKVLKASNPVTENHLHMKNEDKSSLISLDTITPTSRHCYNDGGTLGGNNARSRRSSQTSHHYASLYWSRSTARAKQESRSSTWFHRRSPLRAIVRFLVHLLLIALVICRALLALISFIINYPLPCICGGGLIKDRSALLQQLDRRIVSLCRWPFMWLRSSKAWHNDAFSNASFMCFGSSLAQCAVDIISGLIVGVLLRTFAVILLQNIHSTGQILHVDVLRRQIIWLMGLPAGMKLNVNLDQTLGSMVLYGIDFWNAITTVMTPLEPLILRIVSFFGFFGMSMVIACCADLLSLMTLHINFVHIAFSRLYSLALAALSALWKLFRGLKRNVLKQRIDSRRYDVDQLLLGTLLFTLIFFLFPTVAIYHLFFAIGRFLITLAEASLW